MNILKNLLFSFEGKIGRADYIYGIIFLALLFLVSIDVFIYPNSIFLLGGGIDKAQIIAYLGSCLGIWFFVWSYIAVTSKRARALGIELRWTFLCLIFPPLLLVGFMEDSEKYEYMGGLSVVDQIFFYIILILILICLFTLYEIQTTIRFILFVAIVIAGLAAYLFWRDKYPLRKNSKIKYVWIDAWIDLCFVLLIVIFIRSYVISPFQIIGPSMESTFHGGNISYSTWWQKYGDGEFILVDKMTYRVSRPLRGDVVVFSPGIWPEKRYLIKRVIGLPGDTVKIENGYVSVAREETPEKFIQLDESDYLVEKFGYTCLSYSGPGCDSESEIFVVPKGRYFLMWDNRPQSLDARKCFSNSWCNGEYTLAQFVPISRIQWRVAYSLWHFDIFSQILPYPKIGTFKSVVPFRGLEILNTHEYPEFFQ